MRTKGKCRFVRYDEAHNFAKSVGGVVSGYLHKATMVYEVVYVY